jgi:transaldolase
MLDDGRIQRYVSELGVTGLTSNPTIFDEAIGTGAYDEDIARKAREGKSGEPLFTELALDDLRRAAALFRPAFDATGGVDGWVSMELSPLLAADTAGSVRAAAEIHRMAAIPNLFVKIPGTPAVCPRSSRRSSKASRST